MLKGDRIYISFDCLANGDVLCWASTEGGVCRAAVKFSTLRTVDETIEAAKEKCKVLIAAKEASNAKK